LKTTQAKCYEDSISKNKADVVIYTCGPSYAGKNTRPYLENNQRNKEEQGALPSHPALSSGASGSKAGEEPPKAV
jgi:hypothetical protein